MGDVNVLIEVLTLGGKVLWDPPDRPRLLVPGGVGAKLREDLGTVREVLRRAVLFREQANTSGPIPLLVLPEHPGNEGCISCGSPVDSGHFRCPVCSLAVAL
ncbi:MAG: hypothetical protein HY347_01045, partial [candidate division NC10 bacterium]|nr:hypothetical protein [candidate division NC10 bacterium]